MGQLCHITSTKLYKNVITNNENISDEEKYSQFRREFSGASKHIALSNM
jgi:hypothetical protein